MVVAAAAALALRRRAPRRERVKLLVRDGGGPVAAEAVAASTVPAGACGAGRDEPPIRREVVDLRSFLTRRRAGCSLAGAVDEAPGWAVGEELWSLAVVLLVLERGRLVPRLKEKFLLGGTAVAGRGCGAGGCSRAEGGGAGAGGEAGGGAGRMAE